MTAEEAICWAFDTVPSRLRELYWSHTLDDLRTKVRLKVGYETTVALQSYNTLASIVTAALGGKSKSSGKRTVDFSRPLEDQFDQVFVPKNEDELKIALNAVLGR